MTSTDDAQQISSHLGKVASDVAVLTARYETVSGKIAGLDAKFDALSAELSRSRQTPWALVASFAMLAFVLIGGGWTVVDLRTRLTVAEHLQPLATDVAHLEAGATDAEDNLGEIASSIRSNGERIKAVEGSLLEIESQFCWLSDQVNLRFQQRGTLIALLWEKVMGQKFPMLTDVPRVGRCAG